MKSRPFRLSPAAPFLLGLGLACVLVAGYLGGRLGTPGKLADPDAYMWLHQVQRWHDGASWYDESSPRSNAPVGETLHWARPFAVVLALPALALSPFFGFSRALFYWGVVCGPVLLIATAVVFSWAVRPLLSRFERLLACGLFLSNPAIVTDFFPSDPDHKCLHALLFAALLGWSIRLVIEPWKDGHAMIFAGLAALSLWSGVEMLFPVVLLELAVAIQWVRYGGRWTCRGAILSAGLAGFGLLALALHLRPSTWRQHLELDSYSLFYFIFLLLLAMGWGLAWALGQWLGRWGRLAGVLIAMVLMAATMCGLHPGCWRGPFGDVDAEVKMIWLDRVQNLLPIVGGDPRLALETALFFLGMPLLALPFALTLSRKSLRERRPAWALISGGMLACIIAAFFVADRWSSQASLYAVAPLAACLARLVPTHCLSPVLRLPLLLLLGNAGIVLASVIGSMPAVSPALPSDTLSPSPVREMQQLPTIELARFLKGPSFPAPQRIYTDIDLGPELLYRTPHEVVATPYHRNGAGILDDYYLMHARDDADAQAQAHLRGATLILVCPTLDAAQIYYGPHARGTLYEKLVDGNPPAWLRTVPLPPELAQDFKLYAVVP